MLGANAHNPTPGAPAGGSSTSCGPNGCPTPPPAAPPAPGSPVGPSSAGTGGPGGPGHAGGSGAARLNAAGSTDPNATGPATSGPKQNALEANQSPNTARGPPPPTTDPNTAPGTSGPARPTPASPNDEGGFFGGIKRAWDSIAGTNVANEPHDGGYIPAHGNTPAQVDEGRAEPVDLVEKEADAFSYIPGPAGREARIAGGAIRGAKELSSEALYGNRVHAPEGPTPAPVTGTSRGEPSAGGGPGRDPVAANPRDGAPTADTGPGRVLPRTNRTPGDGTTRPATRPQPAKAPAGRPGPGAGVRPNGPAGNRPGQRVAAPQSDREPALVGSGAPTQPAPGGRSPEALATPGTRTAPARPQTPRIEDPAPVRTLPDTQPAPDVVPGRRPDLPTPAVRHRPGVGTTPDTGPNTPGQHPAGQPSGSDAGLNPLARPGGQPDGPPTIGGGEKARGDVHHNGQLYRWDDQQQQWHSIARVDPSTALPPTGGNPAISSSGHPRIADLDDIFRGQPAQRQHYQDLSTKPADTLSPDDVKFVHGTREQQTIKPGETMTKVISKEAADKTIDGSYRPDVVRGFVARARDADQLRTPQQLRDGLGLDDSFSIAAAKAKADEDIANGKTPDPWDGSWTPIKDNAEYAYQMRWQAEDGPDGMSVPYGAPEGTDASHVESQIPGPLVRQLPPFTGTGTTSGGIPEWVADNAPIGNSAQIWRIDRSGNRELYAQYDPHTNTWSPTR